MTAVGTRRLAWSIWVVGVASFLSAIVFHTAPGEPFD
jgi:hypothetical protein